MKPSASFEARSAPLPSPPCGIRAHSRREEIWLGLGIRSGRCPEAQGGAYSVPADIGLHCALLVETHPLYRDGTNISALENRGGESSTTAGSPLHFRTPRSVFRI